MTPIVAIVGRPNVGKSTIFNRFAGKRLAIVDDQPGVTRDRHYADANVHGREVTLVDTGGLDPESDDPMRQGIARQVFAAVEEADVVLCVLDGSQPSTHADREAVGLLRRSSKPVIYLANKADNQARAIEASELYALGIEELYPVSAIHGRGFEKVERAILEHLPPLIPAEETIEDDSAKIALVGRPNAGKSSLFNHLSGSERALVDDRPGTTRDPVDTRIHYGGRNYLLVDTAGIRRRAKVERGVEAISVMRSIRALERAEVVVLMCDASEGVAEQDARILGLTAERKRALVVGLNKMDLLSPAERKKAEEQARTALHFARWAPIVPLSAKTGHGINTLMERVWTAASEFKRRVPTGELNRFFEQVLLTHPPPTSGGRAPRIYYVTQVQVAPPVFVAVSNAPANIDESYKRFVQNQIRKVFGFESVPVTVHYRGRGNKKSADTEG
jgi:GTP-binding protein